jgi:hypothetical protein
VPTWEDAVTAHEQARPELACGEKLTVPVPGEALTFTTFDP